MALASPIFSAFRTKHLWSAMNKTHTSERMTNANPEEVQNQICLGPNVPHVIIPEIDLVRHVGSLVESLGGVDQLCDTERN